ncbi:hypothetical protein FSP39_017460 [Pinctada imbricata]|uniref:Transmembrane protein 131 n=1 Tax=Pinctada imbricata TaxID=66713 RepID=A0AA89C5K9_PINIB|nr:hypothetical protein FSP39_017460 [Pinctada imbricata]
MTIQDIDALSTCACDWDVPLAHSATSLTITRTAGVRFPESVSCKLLHWRRGEQLVCVDQLDLQERRQNPARGWRVATQRAFIQTDNHLTYIGESGELNGIPLEVNPGHYDSVQDIFHKSSAVRLDPEWLDFQERPVGMPYMEQVLVQNTDTRNDLHLLSISGSTVHFHCSFFQEKTVPPGGNTTFDVVFLARQEGNVENTLYIHTSAGSFTYHVFGVGIPNPYRVRPYLGAKVPLNSSFSSLIQIHNPHGSTLQVIEMFSSEGDLHLELPTGEKEGPKTLWEIPPYETKAVMKARFIGRVESNHTAFIRIKTNQEQQNQLLILPVEVEVSSAPGIYSPTELIDFGIIRTLDGPSTVQLSLLNTGNRPIHISSVSLFPPNDAITVEFRPTKLHTDSTRHTPIARLTFNAEKAVSPKQWIGKIIIRSRNNQHKISIPYKASVLHGSLVYNINNTHFFSAKDIWNYTKLQTYTNTFNFSIVIYNASIPAEYQQYFTIKNFTRPVVIRPRRTLSLCWLQFHPNVTQLHFTTHLILHTNASVFNIPIVVYNGLLTVIPHRPEKYKGKFDFGTMGMSESRSIIFTLRNDNPVNVHLAEISPDLHGAKVYFLGMEKGGGTILSRKYNTSDIDISKLKIKPYHFAVFSLNMTAPDYEGAHASDMIITTQFEDIWIPLTVRIVDGTLLAIPENVLFDRMYPGMVDYRVLQMHSTFQEPMEVTQVSFNPPDSRFYYEPPSQMRILLAPSRTNNIGRIYFDARKECKDDCYTGLPTATPAGHQWLLGLGLDKDVVDTDQYLYTRFQQKWKNLKKSNLDTANVTIEVDTNEVQGFLYSAQAHLHWPSLVRKTKISFPLTQIGNTSISDFIIENPGDVPVLIQILSLPLYPNPHSMIDLLQSSFSEDLPELVETEDLDIFTLPDLEQYNPSKQNPVPGFRKYIETTFGVKPHKQSITTLLHPGVKVKVRVGFQPRDHVPRTSLILIRNNLTIFDSIVVQGQGGRGEMKLSNKKPGSPVPLQFDMTEKHLKNCDKKKHSKGMIPNFTVRRPFTLKNSGELPFYVLRYSINGHECEGYGFRVLDCDGFELLPNTSRRIDIAFTPDFTMSRIQRTLTIFTSLGPEANYTLQATVPPHTLSKCSAALPRPNWEPVLYYSIACVMGFLLFCTLVAAYFEADRIYVADIIRRKVRNNNIPPYDSSKVFDLKKVGETVHSPSIKLVATTQTTPVRIQPKPIVEVANGHIEHPTGKKESFPVTLMNIIRNLFSQKTIRSQHKKSETEKPAKSSQSVMNGPTSKTVEKPQPVTPDVTEKSINHSNHVPQRGRSKKAAKRQNSNDLPNSQAESDRRQSTKEANSQDRKSHDYKNDVMEKERITKLAAPRTSNVTEMDSFDLPYTKNDHITNTDNKKGKKRNLKLRVDTIVAARYSANVDDETSSTTTESSVGDVEEKSSSTRDSTPEPIQPKQKKPKSKARTVKTKGHFDDTIDDDDFELTSKSKAHKKIKNQKEVYGGDIFHPDSLDLPYTMDSKQDKKDKAKKGTKTKGNTIVVQSESSSDPGQDDPNWDMPTSQLPIVEVIGSADFGLIKLTLLPAAIGTKAKTAPVGAGVPRNAWKISPPPTPDAGMNSFGLQTIDEINRSQIPDVTANPFVPRDVSFPPVTGSSDGFLGYSQSGEPLEAPQTMMQRLQEERRRRIQEHQMKVMKGRSGQDLELSQSGARVYGIQSTRLLGGGLWSTLTNSANTGWNSLMSLTSSWGSGTNPTTVADTHTTDSSFALNGTPVSTSGQETVGTFNPFNSMADIWSPNAPATSMGWNFQNKPQSDGKMN